MNVCYGGLPPEERKRQVEEFNMGNSILVSSDAIGLGLNLKIARIIFTTLSKFDGIEMRKLTHDEIMQIAGRAGRFGMQSYGLVAGMSDKDVAHIARALQSEPREIEKAGWSPSLSDLVMAAGGDIDQSHPLSELVENFMAMSNDMELDHFFLCDMEEMLEVARVVDHEAQHLSLEAKFKYMIRYVSLL